MRSSIHMTECRDYDPVSVRNTIKEHMDIYPEFRVLAGKRVLVKVNLLSATDPERAVTTNPVFVEAIVKEVRERGGKVLIADSPGGLFTEGTLKKAYKETGILDVARRTGAELNYDTSSHEEKHPEGNFTKVFNISDYIRSADLIIAAPKIKTHMFCGLTCASKIMFGAVPGTEKVKYHTRFPDTVDFSKMLLDLTDLCNVDLFLVDGIVGMDGKGPARGDPRNVGLVLSGRDHTSIDLQVSRTCGLDPEMIPIIKAAYELELIDPDCKITTTGLSSHHRLKRPFKPARGGGIFTNPPGFLKRIMIGISTNKPHISRGKCVGCGVCRDNCAGDAIVLKNGKARIHHSECIRCYCCHELCPHDAVYLSIRESGLANWVGDLGYRLFGTVRD